MELWKHFLASTLITVAVYPFFGFYSILALASGFLIDLDHIPFYWVKHNKIEFNMVKVYNYFRIFGKEGNITGYSQVFRIFHNIETLLLIIVLCLFTAVMVPLLLGFLIHIIMDIFDEKRVYGELYGYSILQALLK